MEFTCEEGKLAVSLSGRIDSSNASEAQKEFTAVSADNPHTQLVLDAEKLVYISSAGLRFILSTRKKEPDMKIVNVSSEVYDILEMTGFTEIVPVEKAYRRLSVDGCEVIGRGANGIVYRLDDETIIKVYFNSDALPDIQRERDLARQAFVKGIPTAIPYDVVKVGDSYGSVFELLNANSFAKLIVSNPEEVDKYVNMYVDLVQKIHQTEITDGTLPSAKKGALKRVKDLKDVLPADQYEKLAALVQAVPESFSVIHGDYHIKNVMMQADEVLLIDMDTLAVGDPVFEFEAIYLAYIGFSENDPDNIMRFLGISREVGKDIWNKVLRMYFHTTDEAVLTEIENRIKLVAYARFLRRVIRRDDPTSDIYEKNVLSCKLHIEELLGKVSSISLVEFK